MMGGSTNADSTSIVKLIAKGSVGAEIGVWKGSTSEKFVKCKPKKLYLVDAWSTGPYIKKAEEEGYDLNKYWSRYAKTTGGRDDASFMEHYNSVYKGVCAKFSKFENVEVRRETSDQFFTTIDDNYLDWIYIDGDHTFTGCYRDLNNAYRVVKEGGIIICDDYPWSNTGKDGVKMAVDTFAKSTRIPIEKFGNSQAVFKL